MARRGDRATSSPVIHTLGVPVAVSSLHPSAVSHQLFSVYSSLSHVFIAPTPPVLSCVPSLRFCVCVSISLIPPLSLCPPISLCLSVSHLYVSLSSLSLSLHLSVSHLSVSVCVSLIALPLSLPFSLCLISPTISLLLSAPFPPLALPQPPLSAPPTPVWFSTSAPKLSLSEHFLP